jgi:putative oxidoreductase
MNADGVALALLLLRLVVGSATAVHGAQKMFGRFGGHGFYWTTGLLAGFGVSRPRFMAATLGVVGLAGGVLFALGLLIPVAAAAIAFVVLMGTALELRLSRSLHKRPKFELDLLVLASVVGVAASGGGRVSLDALSGWGQPTSGVAYGLGVLGVSAVGAATALTFGRKRRGAARVPPPTLSARSRSGGTATPVETWSIGRSVLSRQLSEPAIHSADKPERRNGPALEISVAGAPEGSELIEWLWRRGFAASLAETAAGWCVDVRSSADRTRLLLDVAVALDGWLRPSKTLVLRTGGSDYAMRLVSHR